jgi:hypothetical protein
MKFSFLQLRFISASHSTSSAYDSIVDIKKNGDRYVWIFRAPESSCDKKRLTDVMLITREQVLQHLKMFIDIHRFDMEPYESMQIFPPGFPSVLIPFKHIYQALDSIEALFNTVFDNWAEKTTYCDALNFVDADNANGLLVMREQEEDDDEDDDEDYEDDEDEEEDDEDDEEEDDEYTRVRRRGEARRAAAAAAEEEDDHDCEIRCVTDGTCCCDFGAVPAVPAPKAEKPRHALGTYYINGVKYVPEEDEYAGMPDLVPFPSTQTSHQRTSTPIPTSPIRTARERHVPHAPPRVHRTVTEDGERVHTFFS